MSPGDIVGFWLEAGPKKWFEKDDAFDAGLRSRFESAHLAAARGEFRAWAETPEGALALLLLLDQVPRNIFRGTAHAFATDPVAQAIAEAAIDAGHDRATESALRLFFYLPLEHAENASLQSRAVALVEALGNAETAKYARLHRDIIARFGRFPHRNAALGRISTPEETEFLSHGGFKG
jgi:uncharacterized protein (DUF924 family)